MTATCGGDPTDMGIPISKPFQSVKMETFSRHGAPGSERRPQTWGLEVTTAAGGSPAPYFMKDPTP